MAFGPDNNLPLDYTKTVSISVPPGHLAKMLFSGDAAWENAICIYLRDKPDEKIAEKGNYGRQLSDWNTPTNNTRSTVTYLITGWHKNTPPNGNQPWHQSAQKIVIQTPDMKVIGFEDGADADYNDIMAVARIEPA
jgi:hypothetical protein